MFAIALTNASLPAKRRILKVCVKLFLEQGYKKTTVAEIIQKAEVSNSSFQNIFRAKDGVLTELVGFMFSNQFSAARQAAGTKLPPVFVYAIETALQITLTELNENLREIYIEAYSQREASEYIFRETARELYQIFGPYQPSLTAQDFYTLELGSAGLMRGYMAHPCDETLTAGSLPVAQPARLLRAGGRAAEGFAVHRGNGYPRDLRKGHAGPVPGAGHALRFHAAGNGVTT